MSDIQAALGFSSSACTLQLWHVPTSPLSQSFGIIPRWQRGSVIQHMALFHCDPLQQYQTHRVIESFSLERNHKDPTPWWSQDCLKLKHMTKSIFQMVLELLTGLVPWWLPWGACTSDWVSSIFINFLNENFWSNEDLALAQGIALWHYERAHVEYSWGDKGCVGMAEDTHTEPSESTEWQGRAEARTPAALLGDSRSCSQDSAGTVSWTQLTDRFQKRAWEWAKPWQESVMAPVPTVLSWPVLFKTMDITCGAKGMECHVDTQPFWEHPQWPERLLSLGNRSQRGCKIYLNQMSWSMAAM